MSLVRVRLGSVAACLVVLQGLALGFGCGGQSEEAGGDGDDDELGGSAGSSTGGSSRGGTAGDAGSATGAASGTGGTSGSAGTSSGGSSSGAGGTTSGGMTSGGTSSGGTTSGGTSSGGASGTAGMAGEGGVSSGAECVTADDCVMVSDCCSCRAEPLLGQREDCFLDCERDACAEGNIASSEVACVVGRCVIARNCAGTVLCPALRPNCGEGRLPAVVDGCWGPCLDVTECAVVPSCSDCGDLVCVDARSLGRNVHCVEPPSGCSAGSYCECLDLCNPGCTEEGKTVSCPCGGC